MNRLRKCMQFCVQQKNIRRLEHIARQYLYVGATLISAACFIMMAALIVYCPELRDMPLSLMATILGINTGVGVYAVRDEHLTYARKK